MFMSRGFKGSVNISKAVTLNHNFTPYSEYFLLAYTFLMKKY